MLHRAIWVALFTVAITGAICDTGRASEPRLPPYRVFAGAGESFEPSAAAFDPETKRLLILSDKDQVVYRYELRNGVLILPEGEDHAELKVRSPAGEPEIKKFESMTRLPDGWFLAATAFDRPQADFRRVVRFRFAKQGAIEAKEVQLDDDGLARKVQEISGLPWFKIEGLAVDEDAKHIFFGVRQVGLSHKKMFDVVVIVRCPFGGERIGAPDAAFQFSTREAVGRPEGLSDLQRDPSDGSYLLLTSHEVKGNRPENHSGHLFRVDRRLLEEAAPPTSDEPAALGPPLRRFLAKPEGLALLPARGLAVTFDDDGDGWKWLFEGYDPWEGLYSLIPAP